MSFNDNEHKSSELIKLLWNGAYVNQGVQTEAELSQTFQRVNQPYRERLISFFEDELRRVKDMPAQGRSFIESFPDCMLRIEPKLKRNYRFITNPIKEELMVQKSAFLLLDRMKKNIREREDNGIDQSSTWETLKSLVVD